MKQDFQKKRCNFNLRKQCSDKPQPIYMVVFIDGKQERIATGVKCYPSQWSKRKQVAIISNINTAQDNKNNAICNQRLEEMRGLYKEWLEQDTIPLKAFINGVDEHKSAAELAQEAFNYYYTYIAQTKQSTISTAKGALANYLQFLKGMTIQDAFCQSGINKFKEWLTAKINSCSSFGYDRANRCGQVAVRLINNVLAVNNEYKRYNLHPVTFVRFQEPRAKDERGHFPLLKEEVEVIKQAQDEPSKWLFLLQCECGQRLSDTLQLIQGNYEKEGDYLVLTTLKENTKAYIKDTEELQYLLSKQQKVEVKNTHALTNAYNASLRVMCKNLGLNRVINRKDSKGRERKLPLWQLISSHCARYTFVRNKFLEGNTKEQIALQAGNTAKMIEDVYLRLTRQDEIAMLTTPSK